MRIEEPQYGLETFARGAIRVDHHVTEWNRYRHGFPLQKILPVAKLPCVALQSPIKQSQLQGRLGTKAVDATEVCTGPIGQKSDTEHPVWILYLTNVRGIQ